MNGRKDSGKSEDLKVKHSYKIFHLFI